MALKQKTLGEGGGASMGKPVVTKATGVVGGAGCGGNVGRAHKGSMAVITPKLPKFESLEHEADFMMYTFKVALCTRRRRHAWSACPYAHPGETARRRDPRTHCAIPCPDMKQGRDCPRRDRCPYSHHDFEYWLHPTRYRTVMCNRGSECSRVLCFFAHAPEELRLTAATRMSGTRQGLGDMGEVNLADLQVAGECDEQEIDGEELAKSQNSDVSQDDNSSGAQGGGAQSCTPAPVSSPAGDDKKADGGDQFPKQEEEATDSSWTLSSRFVDKQASTESLASAKIFSLLANAARIQESLHQGQSVFTATQTSNQDATPSVTRPVHHTRSHSFSTVGVDSGFSRQGCGVQNVAPQLDYGDQFTTDDLKQRSHLSGGEYPLPIERSTSADIATLNQMLQGSDLSGARNREHTAGTGIPVDTPILPVSVAATQIPIVPMATQAGWTLQHEGQLLSGVSAPIVHLGNMSSFYGGSGQDMMSSGLETFGTENWEQQMKWLFNDVNISQLLSSPEGCALDLKSLQEKSYLPPECLSVWQNLLQGWGFSHGGDCGVLGNLPVSLPPSESAFGAHDTNVPTVSGSGVVSQVSEDSSLPRSGSQEEQLPTCQQ